MNEIDHFEAELQRFLRGEISSEKWRGFRLTFGIYGQRQPGVQMVRIRIPGGDLAVDQLRALAAITREFGRGTAHATTRQDFQLHFVPLERVPELMRRLEAAGLTTREACGNNVRNVTACPLSGMLAEEPFEVLPYARAVTRYLMRNPFAQLLPRKFKIAFSGCAEDCVITGIHDVGARAKWRDLGGAAEAGFAIAVGGGLGTTPYLAQPLSDFVPLRDLLPLLRAVVIVFARHGNRRNRNRARMKFVVEKIGIEAFRREVEDVLGALTPQERAEASLIEYVEDRHHALVAGHLHGLSTAAPAALGTAHGVADRLGECATSPFGEERDSDHNLNRTHVKLDRPDPGFDRWLATNVRSHREPSLALVTVELPLGDIDGERLEQLAGLMAANDQTAARLTVAQNMVLPRVPRGRLRELFNDLVALDLASAWAGTAVDVVSCPGADTCSLGITSSKGLARALREELINLAHDHQDVALAGIPIRISGCPNACGHHHIGQIGLHGVAKKVGGRVLPCYQIHLGGDSASGRLALGTPGQKIPARRVPAAVRALLSAFASSSPRGETFAQWVTRRTREEVDALLAPFLNLEPADFGADHDRDWGAQEAFTTEGIAVKRPSDAQESGQDPFAGCGAELHQVGLFLDRGQTGDAAALLYRTLFAVARVLLDAAGVQPDSDWEIEHELRARVIDRGCMTDRFDALLDRTRLVLGSRRPSVAEVAARLADAQEILEEARAARPSLIHAGVTGEVP